MQDVPNSTPNNSKVELEDILDPDERTNDTADERRPAEHEAEFFDGDRDQDGDTMPLPPISRNNGSNGITNSTVPPGGTGDTVK